MLSRPRSLVTLTAAGLAVVGVVVAVMVLGGSHRAQAAPAGGTLGEANAAPGAGSPGVSPSPGGTAAVPTKSAKASATTQAVNRASPGATAPGSTPATVPSGTYPPASQPAGSPSAGTPTPSPSPTLPGPIPTVPALTVKVSPGVLSLLSVADKPASAAFTISAGAYDLTGFLVSQSGSRLTISPISGYVEAGKNVTVRVTAASKTAFTEEILVEPGNEAVQVKVTVKA